MAGIAMLLVILLAAAAFGCARLVGLPRRAEAAIALVGVALVTACQALPGGDPRLFFLRLGWMALLAAPILGYAMLIRWLRRRARRAGAVSPAAAAGGHGMSLDPDELARYARHTPVLLTRLRILEQQR